MLNFITAGESHGKCLVGILEGMLAGLKINKDFIDRELTRRRSGVGRSSRMRMEKDKVEILSGIKKGKSLGSPIALLITNKDFRIDKIKPISQPRPGHADLAGGLKFGTKDLDEILERASARETAMRAAIGAICKLLLKNFKIGITSRVHSIGGVKSKAAISNLISQTKRAGDTLGGIFEINSTELPPGLGSYVHWQKRLDARLAAALMSIPAIKGVDIGAGFKIAHLQGSVAQDEIFYAKNKGFYRRTNNAGGLEGGVTNGEALVLRCAMKPISTLKQPLSSVDIRSKKSTPAAVERADVCAVESAAVVAEAMVAFILAQASLEKFGGDSLAETKRNYQAYLNAVKKY